MLQPVKEGFFLLAEEDAVLSYILQWCIYYAPILEQANNRHNSNRQAAHTYVVEHLPQLFHLLERMLASNLQERLSPAIALLVPAISHYFQFSVLPGLNVLAKLLFLAQQQENLSLEALISEMQADLLYLIGHYQEAEKLFTQAETLYRRERNSLGIAYTLRGRAHLLRSTGQFSQAEDLYTQAESLFRLEKSNVGIANTLRGRADLLCCTNQLSQAEDLYTQVELLYLQEGDNLGIANTLLSRAELLRRTGHPSQAEDLYTQAESLFRLEKSNVGIANTLRGRASLYISSQDYHRAIDFLLQALPLYESEQDPLGISVTCARLSRLYLLFEDQAHQAPVFEHRARKTAETLAPNQKEDILFILDERTK